MHNHILYPDLPLSDTNLDKQSRQFYLDTAKDMNARRVWIAVLGREVIFAKDRTQYLEEMKDHIAFFHRNDMEVGIWTSTLGFGAPLGGYGNAIGEETAGWARITPIRGGTFTHDAFCPSDPDFTRVMADYFQDLAGLGAELIMLDDEFCLSVRPGIGCFCDRHMKLLSEKVGEELDLAELPKRIFTGGPNPYRDAWYTVMGDTLRNFCSTLRQAVDRINPAIRMGVCAGYTSWDIEGVDSIEISRILAGNTKPFFRFTSAPYWVSRGVDRFPGQKLNSVIECARLQKVWCKNDPDIEVFAENDTYPRPCYHVGTALTEQFELAMQADGIRSLKYVFDYVSSTDYEPQYIRIHQRNLPLYQHIREVFGDKESTGVRLFRPAHTIRDAVLPDEFIGEKNIMRLFFSQAAAMLTGIGIPVCYDDPTAGTPTCAAAFGEDVLAIPDLDAYPRMILDLSAAKLLAQRGIDVGLLDAAPAQAPYRERFGEERILLTGIGKGAPYASLGGFYKTVLKEGASVESVFQSESGDYPSSYRYSNGTTEFLVLTFDALAVGESSSLFVSYCRQNQLMNFIGSSYPYIRKQPHIYALCAESADSNTQAVLFENLGTDIAFDFTIELGKSCETFTLWGADGRLSEDRKSIHIAGDFVPASALVLEVTYCK